MHALTVLLLVASLSASGLCDDDCNETIDCPVDSPEVCVLHNVFYCFTKFESLCAWNRVKCEYNLDFQVYDLKFCDLENFACTHPDNEHKGEYLSFNS